MSKPLIHIIEDQAAFRTGLCRLLQANGFNPVAYGSADEFLKSFPVQPHGCILLDVNMPGLDGLGLQEILTHRACPLPIVFLTGRGSIPMGVKAIKCGAVDFLTKPVSEADLLRALDSALKENARRNRESAAFLEARRRLTSLSDRELEVVTHVITGALNKQIADRLHIAEKTVKIHRGRAMRKLGVVSVAELVRFCDQANIPPAPEEI